jgi:drug/metabolite transporter (DMT)-like permease
MQILTMFHDKNAPNAPFSMTRVVAFLFTLVFLLTLWTYANKAIPINWPFATLGCVVLLAIPIQAIFAYLQKYIETKSGRALLDKLVQNFVPAASSTVASTVSSTVTTTPAVDTGLKG